MPRWNRSVLTPYEKNSDTRVAEPERVMECVEGEPEAAAADPLGDMVRTMVRKE